MRVGALDEGGDDADNGDGDDDYECGDIGDGAGDSLKKSRRNMNDR
jgi:hypothetical protein